MREGLDPDRVLAAMKERGIANANQLAKLCHVHRATALDWTKGFMPQGKNIGVLTSVLGKSLPWLMGAPVPENHRELIARQVRAELGQGGECPEADLIEAFGAFTFEQRKLLVKVILHGAVTIDNVAPIADARAAPTAPSVPAVRAPSKRRHRHK